jgi:site-specific DNA recombinase
MRTKSIARVRTEESLGEEIAHLRALDLKGLRSRWQSVTGTAGVEQIAARHKFSIRHVNMTISLAFVAPALVRAALEGRLPRGIGVASLRDAPAQWSRQFEKLGLARPAS